MLLLLLACTSTPVHSAPPEPAPQPHPVPAPPPPVPSTNPPLVGDVYEAEEISGAAWLPPHLWVVADEGAVLGRLTGDHMGFVHDASFVLPDGRPLGVDEELPELDLEGLCTTGGRLYAIGSHSAKRKKPKNSKSHKKNLERYTTVEPEPARRVVFEIDPSGPTITPLASLQEALENDPFLAPFVGLPSKENGIDIEGIACRGDDLYVGFRGPVLRGGRAVVAKIDAKGRMPDVRFVDLTRGEGIRDLQVVDGGFLLLTGPMGDGPATGSLTFWNGVDCLPDDGATCVVRELERWNPRDDGAKAEALVVEREHDGAIDALVFWEGKPSGFRTTVKVGP